MALRKTFFVVCLVISVLCLAAGYGIAGQWIGAVMAIITGLAWLLARKYPASGLPLICLLASVCLAVVGQLNWLFTFVDDLRFRGCPGCLGSLAPGCCLGKQLIWRANPPL